MRRTKRPYTRRVVPMPDTPSSVQVAAESISHWEPLPIRKLRERASLTGHKRWEAHTSSEDLRLFIKSVGENPETYASPVTVAKTFEDDVAELRWGSVTLTVFSNGRFTLREFNMDGSFDVDGFASTLNEFIAESDEYFNRQHLTAMEERQVADMRRDHAANLIQNPPPPDPDIEFLKEKGHEFGFNHDMGIHLLCVKIAETIGVPIGEKKQHRAVDGTISEDKELYDTETLKAKVLATLGKEK